jgi:hypothetical protein
MATEFVAKNRKKFLCEHCDYITCNKYDFVKHLQTRKHQIFILATKNGDLATAVREKSQDDYSCDNCKKLYKDKTGLWRHKKKCLGALQEQEKVEKEETTLAIETTLNKDNLVNYLIKENSEFKEMLMEQNKLLAKMCESKSSPIIYNNNSNNNNKTFNLQVFLNETCKDAMNISDFVNSLQIQLSDLENIGEVGFINGISNLIVKNLKSLDVTQRPVHCTDAKREVLYIKDANKWEKEGEENVKLRQVIKHVAYKNTKVLPEFRKKYPDCGKSESKYSDQYNKLIIEAMGGKGDNDKEKEDKIIKNIAKEVVIEK